MWAAAGCVAAETGWEAAARAAAAARADAVGWAGEAAAALGKFACTNCQ